MHFRWIILLLMIFVASMACGLFNPTATPVQQPTSTIQPTQQPTLKPNATTDSGADPQCTVLQDLNLRSGPGTAYYPPIEVLPLNTEVIPIGYNPVGNPGGSWVQVKNPVTQHEGWVNAAAVYVSCNIDLTTLPSVEVSAPPLPRPPSSAQSSVPDGNGFCIDPNSEYKCVGLFSDQSLFQFEIIRNGIELGENDGVEPVSFTVSKIPSDDSLNKVVVYEKLENQMPYCIFGDNGPCNSWVFEDGVYKWIQGGTPVEPGEYEMEANATVNGESSRWAVNFTLTLP
jgi:SH3 domain-containing protein